MHAAFDSSKDKECMSGHNKHCTQCVSFLLCGDTPHAVPAGVQTHAGKTARQIVTFAKPLKLRLERGVGGGMCVSIPEAHRYKLLSVLGCYRRSKQSNRQRQQHVKKQMSKEKRRICPCLKFRGELTSSVTGSAWLAWACQARSCQHHCQVCHSCIFSCTLCREHCYSR